MSEHQTTGFDSWLRRQSEFSNGRQLLRTVREDLAAGRLARMPRTPREFEGYLPGRPVCPSDLQVQFRLAVADYQQWLGSLGADPLTEFGASSGLRNDNPFAS